MGNIRRLLLGLVMMFCSLPLWAGPHTLLVLGDSLSAGYGIQPHEGWVYLLRQRLAECTPPWKVINRSISGDTTAGGLSRLPKLLAAYHPRIVIVELGSNDGLRGLSFSQLRQNLQDIIAAVHADGGQVLLVGGRLPPNYGTSYTDAFRLLFQQVADAEEVPLVPFLMEGVAQDRGLMQADGYHPNARAQPRLLENVWPTLDEMLSEAGAEADGKNSASGG